MSPFRVCCALVVSLAATFSCPAAKELNIFAWSEYVPQAVLDKFTAETGIRVNYETYASNEEMLAKLAGSAARYDLIVPSEYAVEAMRKAGRLEALDFKNLPNIKHIAPAFLRRPHDPEQRFSVPYLAGAVSIVVNTAKVKESVTGFADVFCGKYRGRIAVLNDNRELLTWALQTLGLDFNDITPESLAKARPLLESWLPQVRVFDSENPKNALLSEEVDIGIVWPGEAAIVYREKRKFTCVLPKEGSNLTIDCLAIPKGAPHKADAERFIDFILRPEISALISEAFPYTNPNATARQLLTEEQRSNPASYPPGVEKLPTFRDLGPAAALVDPLLNQLKAQAQLSR